MQKKNNNIMATESRSSSSEKNHVTPPTLADLSETNEQFGLLCSQETLLEYQEVFKESIKGFNSVADFDGLSDYVSEYGAGGKDREFTMPKQEDNIHNAWYVKCNLQGAAEGKLAGKRVAIKDNVAIAGIPMMNGSAAIEGYTPDHDATVVQRTLNQGGTIVGKTTCEDLCFSGASFNTKYGPVRNPVNMEYSSGGSSSGSGVVVATGEADLAIGMESFKLYS